MRILSKIKFLFYFSCIFCFVKCAVYSPQKFLLTENNSPRIPPVSVRIDFENFINRETVDPTTSILASNAGSHDIKNDNVEIQSKYSIGRDDLYVQEITTYWDNLYGFQEEYEVIGKKKVKDKLKITKLGEEANHLISEEFKSSINESSNKNYYGFAVWRIIDQSTKNENFYFFSSLLTLFIPNLLGYPVSAQKTNIVLEVDILDINRQKIATYSAKGKATAYSAMYWGYNMQGAIVVSPLFTLTRASNLKAFSNALYHIREQIQQDAVYLKSKLNEKIPRG